MGFAYMGGDRQYINKNKIYVCQIMTNVRKENEKAQKRDR